MKPTSNSVSATFDEGDIYATTFQRLLLPSQVQPAVKRATVGYQRSYFVQTTDLDSAITDARRTFVQQEYRQVTDSSAGVGTRYASAKDLGVATLFATEAGATTHLDYLLDLYGVDTELVSVAVSHKAMLLEIGECVRLTLDRFNIDDVFCIVGIGVDASRKEVQLLLLR